MSQHEETIKCPSCGTIQNAIVKITIPFYTYIHRKSIAVSAGIRITNTQNLN